MTTYSAGTISVGASSTSVTGVGTAWLSAGVRAGDRLVANGLVGIIATVGSGTSITLKRPWAGSTISGGNYDIEMVDDGVRSLVAANTLLQTLGAGTLTSLGALSGAANKMPYWTGPGVMAAADLTPAARAILALTGASGAKIPVVTAAGAAALRDILGTVSQSSGVPTGAIVERGSNANGEYVRFADGTQICTKRWTGLGPVSTAEGSLYMSAGTTVGAFAAAFVAAPHLSIRTGGVGTGERTWGALTFYQDPGGYAPANNGQLRIMSAVSSAATTFAAEITAVGRWF